jgi:two-component system, chemotaxis family, chemotaxis protein CheY
MFKTLKVLLVEDDASTRLTARAMLNEIGINQIIEAYDGKKALNCIQNEELSIDLIISDWNMPNKSGFEFLREIRTSHPQLPFLMITARADESSVSDAKNAGVTGYIRKPFSINEMEMKIRSIFPAATA